MKFSSWAVAAIVAVVRFTPAFALAPSAGPDSATTGDSQPVTINVLANDFREPALQTQLVPLYLELTRSVV
jgi:hypothetical protein